MPRLGKNDPVEIKLDGAAALLEVALSPEQRRHLWETPGAIVVAVVELSSREYTGYAEGEDKTPRVRLRVTGAEVARGPDEERALREARRAMFRRRRMDGTFDEVGPGPTSVTSVLATEMAGHPTEAEYREHERERAARARTEYPV
ncbi:hypothetical protein [Streptomyces sp. URMC 129]|uniref:hypothetical protein n=1 Tax=Streptomyces sp. URMC 129 TaxID=3423407 RepID=UPI003F1CF3B7